MHRPPNDTAFSCGRRANADVSISSRTLTRGARQLQRLVGQHAATIWYARRRQVRVGYPPSHEGVEGLHVLALPPLVFDRVLLEKEDAIPQNRRKTVQVSLRIGRPPKNQE